MAPYFEETTTQVSALADDESVHIAPTSSFEHVGKELRARGKMVEYPKPPNFEDKYEEREYLKGRLAAAFRIFGKYGFDEGFAGHITMRDPVLTDRFWVFHLQSKRVNPFGKSFSMIKKSDLLLVDHHGTVIDGGENRLLNTAAYTIHSAIHVTRPDVVCAAHSHSLYGRTWCSLGRKLDMLTQDSCAFHDDHVVYDSFNGAVLAEQEGNNIAACLGDKKAALLQNHGLLTVGQTIEAAVFWFISLEKCCHSQLMAEAAAASRHECPIEIGGEEATRTYGVIGTPAAGWFAAKSLFEVIHQETNGDYLR
ncbi:arad-like aldolase/epimerase [Polychaeton citri CBS 116435]|uniref:Arad-like aldolase/epimerase n=1 Tax=Polychaeton citri CBS 116435 TaxID=1314669 RepID=A0A9P4QCC8_9PEZI|nr:arad-like aldolase/epimerase [Polychaeton citri CBS 116435]